MYLSMTGRSENYEDLKCNEFSGSHVMQVSDNDQAVYALGSPTTPATTAPSTPSHSRRVSGESDALWTVNLKHEDFDQIAEEDVFAKLCYIPDEGPLVENMQCKSLDEILAIGGEEDSLKTSFDELEVPEAQADQRKQILLQAIDELIDAYKDEAFQAQLQILKDFESNKLKRPFTVEGRAKLCYKVQRAILPKYGFTGLDRGLGALALAAWPYVNDPDVQEKMTKIDVLLGLPSRATFRELCALVKIQQPNLRKAKVNLNRCMHADLVKGCDCCWVRDQFAREYELQH